MSEETAIVVVQELRRLSEKVDTMGVQLARLVTKVQRPDLVKYSVDEACERMGIGRSKLYEEINAGRLESIKEGRRTFITEESVQSWERDQRRQSN